MKPLGLRPFHHKVDHRLHKKHRKVPNWWEAEQEPNKTAAKREADTEIQAAIQESEAQGPQTLGPSDLTDSKN